MKSNMMNYH